MSKVSNISPTDFTQENMEKVIDSLSEEQLLTVAQTSVNWMTGTDPTVDEDGFAVGTLPLKNDLQNYSELQTACWDKFVSNPQINSHVRDYMGSLTGMGFRAESQIFEIQEKIDEIVEDPRNNLSLRMSQYVARSEIEGELFLSLTLHKDGFVEIDFLDPSLIQAGGDSSSGIFHHPNKSMFPLVYRFSRPGINGKAGEVLHLPSINIAHFPEMKKEALKLIEKDAPKGLYGKNGAKEYSRVGGLTTFVVQWDRGFLTNRNVSHLKTTLVWLNHYESLKRWEIDHKKSAGSYLWVATIEDAKAYRAWLKLTPEQRAETGLFAKKVPGGTIVLPPGMSLECKNPNLSSISGQDTDIMQMVTSGLNRPEDMVLGGSMSGSKSGIQATRGPQSDRTQDQIAYFERFLRFEFWRSVFLLCYRSGKMEEHYTLKEATSFEKREPVFKKVKKKSYQLIDFEFPQSEVSDIEAKARALLGVKHGSVAESLGIPHTDIAKKLGFGSYYKRRLVFSTEADVYPKTPLAIAIDAAEESAASQEPANVPGPTSAPKPGNSEAVASSVLIRRKK
jgi:hypothetical protein